MMVNETIDRKEFFGLNHYRYGEAYFGSCNGMRYRLAADPLRRLKPDEAPDGLNLLATVWPEPYSYAATEEEKRSSRQFSFSEEGLTEAVNWLNAQYLEQKERWQEAKEAPLI